MSAKFLGLCIVNRETGRHDNHLFFTYEEMGMPGYVETVGKTYEGSDWKAVQAGDCDEYWMAELV